MLSNRQSFELQMVGTSTSLAPDCQLKCHASDDSILDYGQYVRLSTRNFLCSAPTGNSTMDFSTLPVNDGVLDSLPEHKRRSQVPCSPSPLRSRGVQNSSMVPTDSNKATQRKLYNDASFPIVEVKSQLPNELHGGIGERPVITRPRPRCPLSTEAGKLEKKIRASSCSHSLTHTWDSWERRSLQAQWREHIRQENACARGGYSRGPEILKALEKLKKGSQL